VPPRPALFFPVITRQGARFLRHIVGMRVPMPSSPLLLAPLLPATLLFHMLTPEGSPIFAATPDQRARPIPHTEGSASMRMLGRDCSGARRVCQQRACAMGRCTMLPVGFNDGEPTRHECRLRCTACGPDARPRIDDCGPGKGLYGESSVLPLQAVTHSHEGRLLSPTSLLCIGTCPEQRSQLRQPRCWERRSRRARAP
jgi:hypothetical protein